MVTLANITHRDPDILSGSLVFVGTRVPVRSLFDYLEGGESIDEFLHQFPSVKREFAIAVLDAAYETVAADANIARREFSGRLCDVAGRAWHLKRA